jgi:hypothetical protein
MTFADFVSILDQSINDEYGWVDTWKSFTVNGRWFSISGNKWPNSFDDYTGALKLHPQTVKKLLADELAEEVEYRKGRGTHNQVKNKDHIKLILTEKGQALVKKRPTYDELAACVLMLQTDVDSHHEPTLSINYNSFTWCAEYETGMTTFGVDQFELVRDGLMKALADVHEKIEDAHRQEIKEERDDADAVINKLKEENATLLGQCNNAESQLGICFGIMFDSQIAEYQHLFERSLHIEDSASTNHTQQGEN